MAYSDFDLRSVRQRFGLVLNENVDLFAAVPTSSVNPRLRELLNEWSPVALAVNTEKARSEMIIAPILMELVLLCDRRVSLFSGISFDIDAAQGLNGVCDYLLSRSPERFYVSQPVVAVVEAKKENISAGLGQCAAEMVAARTCNEQAGISGVTVFGAVTTGSNWRFLRLEAETLFIDLPEYYLDQIGKILNILRLMVEEAP